MMLLGLSGSHPRQAASLLRSRCCSPLQEALIASKLDAIAAEYNHLLACQLDSQRQYYEGLLAQVGLRWYILL